MKPFLEDLAEKVINQFPRLEELTVIFPNRRASLFFRGYLSAHLKKPAWSPKLITIEELFHSLSDLQEADRLSLIFKLYKVYRKLINHEESFDKFYFWGEMLLRDFDEVDKYLIEAPLLFKDLSKLRELDETFDYLTEDQKKFLTDFWLNFEDKPSGSKEEFLKVWQQLPKVYVDFVKSLRTEGLGYEGMIHREVAERIRSGKLKNSQMVKAHTSSGEAVGGEIIFAGFNALTKSEEVLLGHFVAEGARIFWDVDSYYVNDHNQEAGQFFRQYKKHPVLGSTFDTDPPSNFTKLDRSVSLFGVPQKVGQAKLLGQLLDREIIPSLKSQGGNNEEIKTVIVLPDESLLLSVLHALPEQLKDVNVTMGYPLGNTPLYNLLELLIDLQINRRDDWFSHRQVTAILAHAYVLALDEAIATSLRLDIIGKNRVYIRAAELQKEKGVLDLLFRVVNADAIASHLLEVVQRMGSSFDDSNSFDREYAFHFHRHLSRLHEVLHDSDSQLELTGFQKLFRQVILAQKIPFTGEPLKGLQIMGVLETRNLDFENVFILSLNEGSFPAAPRQGSYIPRAIRKAYLLPTHEHQDAIYAYLFYRILQRSNSVRLFYNTEPDVLGMGEMSRFVQQLIHESGWQPQHHILSNPILLKEEVPIEIAKTADVLEALLKYTDPSGRGISPSALNDYIECSLRFYLKHIAGMREAKEVEEDVDARIFGNLLHMVMDWFYQEVIKGKNSGEITADDISPEKTEKLLEVLIDRAFRKHYVLDETENIDYRGQRVVVRAIVKEFAQRVVDLDRGYAPFTIELLEAKDFKASFPISNLGKSLSVIISGRIDRVDSKGSLVRVIDYKTGKDEATFRSIASLFERNGKRSKAAFQTILYTWLYQRNTNGTTAVKPMLMNRTDLFKYGLKDFRMGQQDVTDVRPYLPEFERGLKTVLEELYNPNILFSQTADVQNCKYCLFKNMCRR